MFHAQLDSHMAHAFYRLILAWRKAAGRDQIPARLRQLAILQQASGARRMRSQLEEVRSVPAAWR